MTGGVAAPAPAAGLELRNQKYAAHAPAAAEAAATRGRLLLI